jgi:hypothetical protein
VQTTDQIRVVHINDKCNAKSTTYNINLKSEILTVAADIYQATCIPNSLMIKLV